MYHISDCKKYNRCPRLFALDRVMPKPEYHPFVRLDEAVTDLAAEKLGVKDCFLGKQNDSPELGLEALKTKDWLVKARFEYCGLRVKVPFLHRIQDKWDLYFLFVGLYPHADDMQFYCDTVWVLEGNSIRLNEIRIVHLNGGYVRGSELNPSELFTVSDCFYNDRCRPSFKIKDQIQKNRRDLKDMLQNMDHADLDTMSAPVRTSRCASRQKCRFYEQCFPEEKELPNNSILSLCGSQYRYQMQKEGRLYLHDADPERMEWTRLQYAQVQADENGGFYADRLALKAWLQNFRFPLIFLDFEWECYAIPPYQGMKPYQVLPFEYSIHIMDETGKLDHRVFLSTGDDRLEMVRSLLKDIPEQGTVIAYNAAGAEMIRIQEFADAFPQYASQLKNINARMKDLQIPFASGLIYDTRMCGTWTLKQIMSMMDDPGYSDLEIHQGMDAVFQWRHLDRADEGSDPEKIREELVKYCGMDSYAMTVVYKWLKQISEEPMHE